MISLKLHEKLQENEALIKVLLQQTKAAKTQLQGLGTTTPDLLSFDEVDALYNKGISEEEKQAWLYYNRKMGWIKYQDVLFKSGWSKYVVPFAEVEKKLPQWVASGILFYSKGAYLPKAIYTYGNIYDRLLDLAADKEFILKNYSEAVFESHEKVLDAAKPHRLSIQNPNPKERPIITAISDFAKDLNLFSISTVREAYLNIENATELVLKNGRREQKKYKDRISLQLNGESSWSLVSVFSKFLYTISDNEFKKTNATEIVQYYLENRALRNDELNEEQKAEIKMNARLEGEEWFQFFLHEVLSFEDQLKLDFTWNRIYNGQSNFDYSKIPIGFVCSRQFKSGLLQISPAQRQGVGFQEAMGTGINAFDVGVGKTMTAICNLAHILYMGKSKRPLIVVPKPTYKKWLRELVGYTDTKTGQFIAGVLSGTGITINDWYNLGTEVLKSIDTTVPVPENSLTVVTYEGFKRIGFSEQVSTELFEELADILIQNTDKKKTAREKELEFQKIREMLGMGYKNTALDMDTVGFDYCIIDEAHRCKNIFPQVAADEEGHKRYKIQSAVSETGVKAFMLLTYLQKTFGRNVMLLTATPFTNSPLEIYSMLSLVAYDSFLQMGIRNIKVFFDLFVLPTLEYVANYKEEIVQKEVIKSFTNRIILSRLIYNHILYKTGEEAGVIRPTKVNLPLVYEIEDGDSDGIKNGIKDRLPPNKQVLTYIKMTAEQRRNQDEIVATLRSGMDKEDPGKIMRALSWSLDNALSPFLYSKIQPENAQDFVANSPKIKYLIDCIQSVKLHHESRKEKVSGQVIYLNRGKDYFRFIKDYLEQEVGFQKAVPYDKGKVDEVAIITSEITEAQKETIKEAFLEGVVKVIIGTATIREGIDLQKNGTVLYNGYPEWNPTDIRQLEGRIWRQGNAFKYVRIVLPLVQDSMDVFVFQKLEEKTARINDIWSKADRGNVLDLESLDPMEVKLALITDAKEIAKIKFNEEKLELEKQQRRTQDKIALIQECEESIGFFQETKKETIEVLENWYKIFKNSNYLTEPKKPTTGLKGLNGGIHEEYNEALKSYEKAQEINGFLSTFLTSAYTDKELLSACRKIQTANNTYFNLFLRSWTVESYKEQLSKMTKIEQTILIPKGYHLQSDLKPVIASFELEYKNTAQSLGAYTADPTTEIIPRFQELVAYTLQRKQELHIEGKTAADRANEFATLNYLLDFKQFAAPVAAIKENPTTIDTHELLALEAQALLLKLRIMNQ